MSPTRPPLFPAWADSLLRVALAAGASFVIGGPLLGMTLARSNYFTGRGTPLRQPIPFDHRHHVRDVGADCRFCHTGVERTRFAGVPSTDLCLGCHRQIWRNAPVLASLHESAAKNQPIGWTRVNGLPDHVFFNHSIHSKRGVGCETCHGRVDQMAQVEQAKTLLMGFCLDCHRDPVPHLVPPDRITEMGLPLDRARGEKIASALGGVHPPTHCSGCHR